MPRPTTKQSLLKAAEEGFKELFGFAEARSEEERCAEFLFEDRDKNIRDVFVHLYEWHRLLLNFVENNRRGVTAAFLPLPYNWKTYSANEYGDLEKASIDFLSNGGTNA